MQIVKTLTYSDVGTGRIKIGDITTSSPVTIKATVSESTLFDNSLIRAELSFDPASGTTNTIRKDLNQSSIVPGYIYDMNAAAVTPAPIGLFSNSDGEIFIELTSLDTAPTVGTLVLFVTVEGYPLS